MSGHVPYIKAVINDAIRENQKIQKEIVKVQREICKNQKENQKNIVKFIAKFVKILKLKRKIVKFGGKINLKVIYKKVLIQPKKSKSSKKYRKIPEK